MQTDRDRISAAQVAYVVMQKGRPVRVCLLPGDADFEAFCLGGHERKDVAVIPCIFGSSSASWTTSDKDRISAAFAHLVPESREADIKAMAEAMGERLRAGAFWRGSFGEIARDLAEAGLGALFGEEEKP